MTLDQLYKGHIALSRLAKLKPKSTLSFKIARAIQKTRPEFDLLNEKLSDLRKELGEEIMQEVPDKDDPKKTVKKPTGQFRIKEENNETWLKQTKELGEVEVDIDLKPIKIHDFKDMDIEPEILEPLLDWFITE